MQINDVYIHRASGRRVKIVEKLDTQGMGGIVTRYRLSGEQRYMTKQQVRAEFAEVREPQMQPERE